ncbi:hypothetical protein PRK78_004449 [Emydomyces testavorans]|uniref:Uncharacterized protein n=1 Tax=Emydomyces testavorans TaxID=2070801 RepID=A0AAF0DHT2_9EURO|nr:hypothetical protein PRK78_004449 [Emydomyces testavorans]
MALSAPVMPVKRRAAASLSPVPTGKKPRPSEEEKEKKEKKKREKEELAGIRVEKSDQIDRLLHLHGAIFHLRKLDRATGDLEVELQELVAALTLLQHSNK